MVIQSLVVKYISLTKNYFHRKLKELNSSTLETVHLRGSLLAQLHSSKMKGGHKIMSRIKYSHKDGEK
jgi:hypothetical protein